MMSPPLNTKEKILEAVIQLLAQGKANFSMVQIARETGISKSALYHFFENKKDLFQQVIFHIFDELTGKIENISIQEIDPKTKLREMMRVYTVCAEHESTVTHFIFRQVFEHDPEILKKIHTMREQLKSFFVEILEEGMAQGVFRTKDVAKSAEIMVGYLDFIALRSAFHCPAPDRHISADDLCDYLLSLFIS